MTSCPSCDRPVAVRRTTCLYCGAEIGEDAASATRTNEPEQTQPPGPARALLVADLTGVGASALAEATGWVALEADQRVRRGGWNLLHVEESSAALARAERYARFGLAPLVLDEAQVRRAARPWRAAVVGWKTDVLELRSNHETLRISRADLLLVVRGAIHREYQARATTRHSFRTATLEQGVHFHLHRHGEATPIELAPGELEFDGVVGTGSSLLRIGSWMQRLAEDCEVDENFRFLPPALGPFVPEAQENALAAVTSLHSAREKISEQAVILDNLAQFRFYSAWRGIAERSQRRHH
jgi:hypothetical protein